MWTETQKQIIKGCYGEFNGDLEYWKMRGMYKPQFFDFFKPGQRVNAKDAIHLQETQNTNRACRSCQGNGYIYAIFQGHGNLVVKRYCPQCHGERVVHG